MQSFNYNEQDNKEQQQQQQILFNQDYVAGKVNTNYNVEAEASVEDQDANNLQQNEDLGYIADGSEQLENNIEYDESRDQSSQTTYFDKVSNDDGLSSQFYTTLPNREAAEKLAALAAAGNVNSQLIGQLRKQQQQETVASEEAMPPNHKHEDQQINDDDHYDHKYQDRTQNRQKQRNSQQEEQYEEQKEYDRQQHRQRQSNVHSDKRPLRIMVPDENKYSDTEPQSDEAKENLEVEYEYENDETDTTNSQPNSSFDGRSYEQSKAEFGSRLSPKTAA